MRMRKSHWIGKMMGVLAVLMVPFVAMGVAEEERTDADGQWTYILEGGGATITGYTEEPSGDLVIPTELDGHPVMSIGESALADCMDLSGVTIPKSVTSIEAEAFGRCMSLADVTIPDGVTSIGEWAFKDCVSLTDVTIGSGVTSIGGLAFFACESLTNVTVPASVTYIGESAFAECGQLILTVQNGSFAEQYAKENDIPYVLAVAAMAADGVFARIAGNTFHFSSGVGGWSTEVIVSEDGSFTGHFHDSDMGDIGDGYPDGTRYECFFSGMFVVTGEMDQHTYALRLAALNLDEEAGAERIVDGVRVITAGAYGMEGGDVFMLYCPGRNTADLPEAFLEWIRMPNAWEEVPDELPFYGLYNAAESTGFYANIR